MAWPSLWSPLLLCLPGCAGQVRQESQTPFDLGKEARAARNYATAIGQFTIAIDNARDYVFTAALLERGECFLRQAIDTEAASARDENLKRSLEDFRAVLGQEEILAEEKSRALLRTGQALLARSDVTGADQSFHQVLDLYPPAADLRYRLEAHRELGWILFDRARQSGKEQPSAAAELATQELFREAQDHFSRGLQIAADDEECNLGKGICLHSRRQDREAMVYLTRSTALTDAKGLPNPRGHYYLALALELEKGFQKQSLEHYQKAVEQDSRRAFTPLYAHFVNVLLVYVPFTHPQFQWFLDSMLDYEGDDPNYWTEVEAFAARLVGGSLEGMRVTGRLARSLARARSGKIDAAFEDALDLQSRPDFLESIARIFPVHSQRPDYLYGRAMTLLGAKRNAELETFFDDPALTSPSAQTQESEYFHRALVIKGRNIIATWREKSSLASSPLDTGEKLERNNFLGKARASFQIYLERLPNDHQVRMALGEVEELMEAYSDARLSYAFIAREEPDHAPAMQRIMRLYSDKLLPEKDLTEAWIVLRGYSGDDAAIRDYVRRTQIAIQEETRLFCASCGRKGAEGDVICLECGRQIGPTRKHATAPVK